MKLFASLREAVGTGTLEIEVEPGATVGDVMAHVRARYPSLQRLTTSTVAAVNAEYVSPQKILCEGDEVALIPPISGG